MKIINKNIDSITEARKSNYFKKYSDEADVKIRFANAVYGARMKKRMSRQELAEKAATTQKRISNIENADIDLGMSAIYRMSQALCFDSKTLAEIFACGRFSGGLNESEQIGVSFEPTERRKTAKVY